MRKNDEKSSRGDITILPGGVGMWHQTTIDVRKSVFFLLFLQPAQEIADSGFFFFFPAELTSSWILVRQSLLQIYIHLALRYRFIICLQSEPSGTSGTAGDAAFPTPWDLPELSAWRLVIGGNWTVLCVQIVD